MYENDPSGKSVTIIRPTVYLVNETEVMLRKSFKANFVRKFIMIGKQNKKSMAYVGNIVAFIKNRLESVESGFHTFLIMQINLIFP